ncbi:MAG: sigma-70 family RNA polymerase sigma factor, partial [Bacteroidota bacterium]
MSRDLFFKEIIRRNETRLRRKISQTIFSDVNVDDIYQDLCLHILKKIRAEEDGTLSRWESETWLVSVTGNFCIDILRKLKSSRRKGLEIKSYTDDSTEMDRKTYHGGYADYAENDPSRSAIEIDLREAIQSLNERDRTLISLRYLRNLSIKEMDELNGRTDSAVYLK